MKIALFLAGCAIAIVIYELSPLAKFANDNLATPLGFQVSQQLGSAPQLDERPKITTMPFDNFIAFLCCVLGVLAIQTIKRKAWYLLIYPSIFVVGIAIFVSFSVVASWHLWIASFFLGTRSRVLLRVLTISVQNRSPFSFGDKPQERLITVMFIDMVGFSLSSEDLTPKIALDRLSSNINYLTEKIYHHGGKINKTLGDGILAYFGYSRKEKGKKNHAEAALLCAIEIQEDCLERCTSANKNKYFTYPLRIGINTDLVYIGSVGNDHEMALVGGAVVFASRLEYSCEPFRVMLGSTTRKFLSDKFMETHEGMHKRWVKIKHYDKLFEAYEYNPFHGDLVRQSQAKRAYRKFLDLDKERDYKRWPIPDRSLLILHWGTDRASILNVSNCGFAIETVRYLAKGVIVEATLTSPVDTVNHSLRKSGLMPLRVEVKWGQPVESEKKFKQGVRVISLNHEQGEALLNICLGVLPATDLVADEG